MAKGLIGIDDAYKRDDDVFRARQAEVAGYVRRLSRGATGYEYYSYFGFLDPHALGVDPVGLINFTDPSKGGKLRNYQGACRSMGRQMTPKMERDYDKSVAEGLAEKLKSSKAFAAGSSERMMIRYRTLLPILKEVNRVLLLTVPVSEQRQRRKLHLQGGRLLNHLHPQRTQKLHRPEHRLLQIILLPKRRQRRRVHHQRPKDQGNPQTKAKGSQKAMERAEKEGQTKAPPTLATGDHVLSSTMLTRPG